MLILHTIHKVRQKSPRYGLAGSPRGLAADYDFSEPMWLGRQWQVQVATGESLSGPRPLTTSEETP